MNSFIRMDIGWVMGGLCIFRSIESIQTVVLEIISLGLKSLWFLSIAELNMLKLEYFV